MPPSSRRPPHPGARTGQEASPSSSEGSGEPGEAGAAASDARELARLRTRVAELECALAARAGTRTDDLAGVADLELRYALALEATRDGVFDWDIESGRLWHSSRCKELYGFEPATVDDVIARFVTAVHPEDRDRFLAAVEAHRDDGQPYDIEYRLRHPDGSERYLRSRGVSIRDESGKAVRMVGAVSDITARRRLEEQLRLSQRLESVGRLAGGVAHDFNNLLTAIITYAHLVADELPPASAARDDLAAILSAAQRAECLTQQLLAFARKQIIEPRTVHLSGVVDGVTKLLRTVLGEDVSLRIRHRGDDAPWAARVDPGQIDQVLMNLAINARDAMPTGGRLDVETDQRTLSEPLAWSGGELPAGDYVVIRVADTGDGMDEAILGRVFEPFFTTKEGGRGTGLGLATCHGIVAQSGGAIFVESAPGEGTRFELLFPRVHERPQESAPGLPKASEAALPATVLVVEDDPLVRDLTVRVLDRRGYRTLSAESAAKARGIMADQGDEVDLVVTDVVMPGASGRQLADELAVHWPSLKVLYVSGYTEDTVLRHGVMTQGMPFLIKPFTPSQLAEKVGELLGPRPQPPTE